MRALIVLFCVALFPVVSFAAEKEPINIAPETKTQISDKQQPPISQINCSAISDKILLARSGCCSWHGGVCGCSGGRVVCCDGTYSPSCGCHHDETQTKVIKN